MKRISLTLWMLLTALCLGLCAGCTDNEEEEPIFPLPGEDDNQEEYFGTVDFKNDLDVVMEMAMFNEMNRMLFIKMASNGFDPNTTPLMGDIYGYMEKHSETTDEMFEGMEYMVEHFEEYEKAVENLNKHKAFAPPEMRGMSDWLGLIGSALGIGTKVMTKNKADRVKFVRIYEQLNESDKQEVYDMLNPSYYWGTSSKEEWFEMVKSGKKDSKMSYVYYSCCKHCAGFGSVAGNPDKDLVEFAGDLATDATDLTVNAYSMAVPSKFATGAAAAKTASDAEKLAKSKDAAEATENAVSLVGSALGMSSSENLEGVKRLVALTQIMQKSAKASVDYYKAGKTPEELALAKLKNKNKNAKEGDILVAERQDGDKDALPKVVISGTSLESNNEHVVALPEGKWKMTAVSKEGNQDTEVVDAKKGKVTEKEIDTSKKEEEEKPQVDPDDNDGNEDGDGDGGYDEDENTGFPFELKEVTYLEFFLHPKAVIKSEEYTVYSGKNGAFVATDSYENNEEEDFMGLTLIDHTFYDIYQIKKEVYTTRVAFDCNFTDENEGVLKVRLEFDKSSSKLLLAEGSYTYEKVEKAPYSYYDSDENEVYEGIDVREESLKYDFRLSNCPIYPDYFADYEEIFPGEHIGGPTYFYKYYDFEHGKPTFTMNYKHVRKVNDQLYFKQELTKVDFHNFQTMLVDNKYNLE